MKRRFLFCMVAVLAILGASLGVAYLKSIDRGDLGIGDEAAERCTAPALQSFWRMINGYPDYSAEQVINYFGVFAAFAANAYTPVPQDSFVLSEQEFAWKKHGNDIARMGGFLAQVYYRETAERLLVMTVYRGTDGALSVEDNISNASWFTQMLNPWDQYRTARQTFQQIRTEAKQVAACGFRREAGRHSDQRPATIPI
ncbi:hypothetical protein [Rhizobium leguminosarum]|uniref:hypothetical protein n=1 Tax=Rhizobium leguminosarum TaxID=384 RepID=UPI0013EEAD9F|nr:hypothetical protein [Rhizobium leguminosarum]